MSFDAQKTFLSPVWFSLKFDSKRVELIELSELFSPFLGHCTVVPWGILLRDRHKKSAELFSVFLYLRCLA